MMRRIVSIVTSPGSVDLERAYVPLPLGSVAAGERVRDLVHRVLRRTLGVVDASFVLQLSVSRQRASGFLHATSFWLVEVNPLDTTSLGVTPYRSGPKFGFAKNRLGGGQSSAGQLARSRLVVDRP